METKVRIALGQAAPVLMDREDIWTADLDLRLNAQSRFDFDVVGHYARPDIFQLIINDEKQQSVKWIKQ